MDKEEKNIKNDSFCMASQEQIEELDRTAKLLVRRDFDLQQANDQLRELAQAKTQFVSVAAHQLRTPLSGIKWTFQMLLSGDFGPLNKEQFEALERGNTMNNQMIRLVSDLLDVARIESGKFDRSQFTDIDLNKFLLELRDLFLEKERDNKIDLEIKIPELGEVVLSGDGKRLQMVFQNLIDNAFNYTLAGGKISVSYEIKGDKIEFKIQDTGIGISKEEIPRLFNKFFRGHDALKMKTEGTGLGLYISLSIIKLHDGDIWLESEKGKGTTFFFDIPLPPQQ